MICDLINKRGISISYPTVYKYMKELNLKAIINRRKSPIYVVKSTKYLRIYLIEILKQQNLIKYGVLILRI